MNVNAIGGHTPALNQVMKDVKPVVLSQTLLEKNLMPTIITK